VLHIKWSWQSILLFSAGIVFALHPEFGIVGLIIIFILTFAKKLFLRKWNALFDVNSIKYLLFAIGIFVFLRIFVGFQTAFPIQGFLEGLAALMMLLLALYLHKQGYEKFGYGLLLGLLILVSVVIYPRLSSFFDQNLYWQDDSTHVIRTQEADVSKFRAIREDSSWVVHNFSARGPSIVEYQLEIRADKAFRLNMFFIHTGLVGGRYDQLCEVRVEWGHCAIKVNLMKRDWATVGVGGSSWNRLSPRVQIRNAHMIDGALPSLTDVLTDPSRVKGFAFNENALGVYVALIGLLVLIFLPLSWSLVAIIPTLICILLSGSRGALLAFLIGSIVCLIGRSRWAKLLPLMLVVFLFGVVGLQLRAFNEVQAPAVQSMRSLSLDSSSARVRLEIWRVASKAWLENPRTFFMGTGDLTSVMKVQLDARAMRSGLTKDTLTHAHNLWIQTAGESGLLGLCIMLWLWGWAILRAWRSRDTAALAVLAAIFVINSVDYLFFYAPVHLAFWMAVAGMKPQAGASWLKSVKLVPLT
jgi:hypothetical protein